MAREGSETAAQGEGSLWQDKPVVMVRNNAPSRAHAQHRIMTSELAREPLRQSAR